MFAGGVMALHVGITGEELVALVAVKRQICTHPLTDFPLYIHKHTTHTHTHINTVVTLVAEKLRCEAEKRF